MLTIISFIFRVIFGRRKYHQIKQIIVDTYSQKYKKIVNKTTPVVPNWLGYIFLRLCQFFSGSSGLPTVTIGYTILSPLRDVRVIKEISCHEFTHVLQFDRYGFIGFISIYIYDYIRNIFIYRSFAKAYKNIDFEIEARMHEKDYHLSKGDLS